MRNGEGGPKIGREGRRGRGAGEGYLCSSWVRGGGNI